MSIYLLGPEVAHVAQFRGNGQWRSLCGRGPAYSTTDWPFGVASPLKLVSHRYGDRAPTKPWCRVCLAKFADQVIDVFGIDPRRAGGG